MTRRGHLAGAAGIVAWSALLIVTAASPVSAAPWTAEGAESLNVTVLGHLRFDSPRGLWGLAGYVHTDGREFALIGSDSFHVVEVSDPRSPRRVVSLPPARPPQTHPYYVSIAVRGQYAYAATRHGPIVIVDLALPESANVVGQIPMSEFCACSCGHPCNDPAGAVIETLFIDEHGVLYVSGIECGEGMHMYDLAADPTDPPWLCHEHTRGPSFYVHDAHVRDRVLYLSMSRAPRWDILDGDPLCPQNPGPCGSATAPAWISSFSHGDPDLHSHSAWLIDDAPYLVTCDELTNGHVRIWDVSNLAAPREVAEFWPDNTCHSVHHAHVKGRIGYVAWYNKGVQIMDLSDPERPLRIGYYEHPERWWSRPGDPCCDPTLPGDLCGGVPMIDPFLPSGNFIAHEFHEAGDGNGLLVGRFLLDPAAAGPEAGGSLPLPSRGRLRVLDLPGRPPVRIVWEGAVPAGRTAPPDVEIVGPRGDRVALLPARAAGRTGGFHYLWDGLDPAGRPVPSGVYFARSVGGPAAPAKVILVQ